MLISSLFGKERIKGIRIVGLLLSLAGTAIVIARGDIFSLFSTFTWGDAFMLGCPISWAFYTYFAKDALKTTTPLQASTWAILLGFLMILFFVPFETYPTKVDWSFGWPWFIWVSVVQSWDSFGITKGFKRSVLSRLPLSITSFRYLR
jgi:drug/metabolite transporter (DMT)-like permease